MQGCAFASLGVSVRRLLIPCAAPVVFCRGGGLVIGSVLACRLTTRTGVEMSLAVNHVLRLGGKVGRAIGRYCRRAESSRVGGYARGSPGACCVCLRPLGLGVCGQGGGVVAKRSDSEEAVEEFRLFGGCSIVSCIPSVCAVLACRGLVDGVLWLANTVDRRVMLCILGGRAGPTQQRLLPAGPVA